MKQQEVFKKIGGIINEIKEQYEYLETLNGDFNDLELELLAANSQFLTDHIEVLRKINRQQEQIKTATPSPTAAETTVEESHQPEPSFFEPVSEPELSFDPEAEAAIFEFEVPRRNDSPLALDEVTEDGEAELEETESVETEQTPEQPEVIRHELTLDEINEDWGEEETEEQLSEDEELTPEPEISQQEMATLTDESQQPEPAEEAQPAPVINENIQPVADEEPALMLVSEPEPAPATEEKPQLAKPEVAVEEDAVLTLNQRISAQLGNASRVSDHLSGQTITDLKSAISLNDKLLYIKDLFNGYSLAYSEAIDLLNRTKTFEDAEKFLMNSYATKNNWQDKQATADKLFSLLRRKYGE